MWGNCDGEYRVDWEESRAGGGRTIFGVPRNFSGDGNANRETREAKETTQRIEWHEAGQVGGGCGCRGGSHGIRRPASICADRLEIAARAIRFDGVGGSNASLGGRCNIDLGSAGKNKTAST